MDAIMTLTPNTNVVDNKMLDESNIVKKIINAESIVNVYDTVNKKEDSIKLINISLYDNLLIIDKVKYNILNTLWK